MESFFLFFEKKKEDVYYIFILIYLFIHSMIFSLFHEDITDFRLEIYIHLLLYIYSFLY